MAESGLADALASVVGVEGWLSDDQARRLWRAANVVSAPGRVVEIGSFRGRSTIILRRAAAQGVEVVAIDPQGGGDRGPREIEPNAQRGDADHRAFMSNLERAGAASGVRHVRRISQEALSELDGPIDVLYVDGAHCTGRPARTSSAGALAYGQAAPCWCMTPTTRSA